MADIYDTIRSVVTHRIILKINFRLLNFKHRAPNMFFIGLVI